MVQYSPKDPQKDEPRLPEQCAAPSCRFSWSLPSLVSPHHTQNFPESPPKGGGGLGPCLRLCFRKLQKGEDFCLFSSTEPPVYMQAPLKCN